MNSEEYNGYPNYQTWAVSLWIDNDQGSQEYWQEQATEAYKNAEPNEFADKQRRAVWALAEQLKDEHEEAAPEIEPANVYSDLLSSALGKVDWYYIARNMIEEAIENLPEEEEEGQEEEDADSPQAYLQARQH